jgi:hypothetical protein
LKSGRKERYFDGVLQILIRIVMTYAGSSLPYGFIRKKAKDRAVYLFNGATIGILEKVVNTSRPELFRLSGI